MNNQFKILRQGESLPFTFSLGGCPIRDSIQGWVCTIVVKRFCSDEPIIKREIAPDYKTRSWNGTLTHTETKTLGSGPYRLVAVLTNSSTGEERQIINGYRFNVTPSWVEADESARVAA